MYETEAVIDFAGDTTRIRTAGIGEGRRYESCGYPFFTPSDPLSGGPHYLVDRMWFLSLIASDTYRVVGTPLRTAEKYQSSIVLDFIAALESRASFCLHCECRGNIEYK